MIKVNALYENNLLKSVKISGHSGYDISGKDIVCAAVSTMATTTINNILILDDKAITYDTKDGLLIITINEGNDIANKLLDNMLSMLSDLAKSYPNNIKIGGLK